MAAVLVTLLYFAFIFVCIFAFKWFMAVCSILTGNKESLHTFGNLCEKDPPPPATWQYHKEQEERRKEAEHRWMIQHGYDWRKRG